MSSLDDYRASLATPRITPEEYEKYKLSPMQNAGNVLKALGSTAATFMPGAPLGLLQMLGQSAWGKAPPGRQAGTIQRVLTHDARTNQAIQDQTQ